MRGTRAKAIHKQAIQEYQKTQTKSGIQVLTHRDITYTAYADEHGKPKITKRYSGILLRTKLGKKVYDKISQIFVEWHPVTYKWVGFRRVYQDLKNQYKKEKRYGI